LLACHLLPARLRRPQRHSGHRILLRACVGQGTPIFVGHWCGGHPRFCSNRHAEIIVGGYGSLLCSDLGPQGNWWIFPPDAPTACAKIRPLGGPLDRPTPDERDKPAGDRTSCKEPDAGVQARVGSAANPQDARGWPAVGGRTRGPPPPNLSAGSAVRPSRFSASKDWLNDRIIRPALNFKCLDQGALGRKGRPPWSFPFL